MENLVDLLPLLFIAAYYLLSGRRKDVLRKTDGEWKLARREVILAQNVLTSKNLTLLF